MANVAVTVASVGDFVINIAVVVVIQVVVVDAHVVDAVDAVVNVVAVLVAGAGGAGGAGDAAGGVVVSSCNTMPTARRSSALYAPKAELQQTISGCILKENDSGRAHDISG